MDRPIIEAQNLSKVYHLGAIGASSLRESLERLWQRVRGPGPGALPPAPPARRRLVSKNGDKGDTFWALREVSFTVRKGEIVGVIGHNGAGKSTLLKILSRITEPTSGRAVLRGRVGSLLEVGTGFHPELSGRENIYLNGAMLGMRTAEIARKFDEIIAFSEVEEFVDTPVKRYSSGMYVRLAFAVAAHLEPEILLVDEVLAVGDVAFQKKCLGKMDDVAKAGRTVLLVSHAMPSILALCPRVIRVADGGIAADGPAREVVQEYLQAAQSREIASLEHREDRHGDGSTRMVELKIEAEDGGVIRPTSRLKITVAYRGSKPLRHPKFVVSIYDYGDAGLFLLDSDASGGLPEVLPPEGEVVCFTEPIHLTPGRCYANVRLLKGGALADYVPQAGVFDVEQDDFHGSGKMPARDHVLFLLRNQWSVGTAVPV